ncbi:MAG: hypothetical protein ACOY81_05595 [Bacillota bacterium]|uniref:hypothetical protein n=1 Tax=Desulfurispora thermophila TaxID=265470 RepID=UPI00036EE1E5|nr:hypothetical protein [Desulfurispora thermophila]
MALPRLASSEEEIKEWLGQIAVICLSEDFQSLRWELEAIYQKANVADAGVAAFQDALYAFLAQAEEGRRQSGTG